MPRRLALLVATYRYQDAGLRQLTSPGHDAEALADVLRDPDIAGFDVTILVNEPYHVVGRAIGDFYRNQRSDDLTLLYFTGHGVKDDDGRLYLAMTDTHRDSLLFTALSAEQIDYAMESCSSRRKVLVLDCCYSGAFPAGRISKADPDVHTLEHFQGKGRVVLTASDSTQYSFEGNKIFGAGTRSVFTRFLVEGLTTGKGDLDGDGDISLDELYTYVHDRVVEEIPQQRPKKQENVEGRIVVARNVHWSLPAYLRNAIESPMARDRLAVLEGLAHLHRVGNDVVRATVVSQVRRLIDDDSKAVSVAAMVLLKTLNPEEAGWEAEDRKATGTQPPSSAPTLPVEGMADTNTPLAGDSAATRIQNPQDDSTAPDTSNAIATERRILPTARRTYRRFVQFSVDAMRRRQADDLLRPVSPPAPPPARRWHRRAILAASAALMIIIIIIIIVVAVVLLVRPTTDVFTISGGYHPVGVAVTPDGRHAYVTNYGSSTVSVIDTASSVVTTSIPVDVPPHGVAITPDGRHAYVTNVDSGTVSVIDTARNTVTTSIQVGDRPYGVAITPDGRHAYVTNGGSDTVSVIDTVRNIVITSISVGSHPDGVAVTPTPDGRHAYVANGDSDTVSVIDTASSTLTNSIDVGDSPVGVVVTRDGHHAYVANYDSDTVSTIDTASGVVTNDIPVDGPRGVVVTPDGRHLYVTNSDSGTVSVIETASGAVTTTIPVGTKPAGIGISPDGRHVYVTNGDSYNVSVIEVSGG